MDDPPSLLAVVASLVAVAIAYVLIPKKHATPQSPGGVPSPPFVPYCIPVLGSAISMSRKGIYEFLRENAKKLAKKKNGPEPPIITALVGGKRMHFITDPAAFDAAFRYRIAQLSMGPVIADFVQSFFGISSQGLDTTLRNHQGLTPLLDHLLKSDGLTKTTYTVQKSMQKHLHSLTTRSEESVSMETHVGYTFHDDEFNEDVILEMDLMEMIHKVMFRSVLEAVISPTIMASHDDFRSTYDTFEEAMMVAFVNLPMQYFANKSWKARNQLIQWFMGEDIELSDYLKARRDFLEKHGTTLEDQARDNLLWTWAAVSNFLPTLFWMLYFVAITPEALDAIRTEVSGKMKEKAFLELDDLSDLPALDSAFQETLRYTLHFLISRQVMADMELDLRTTGGENSKFFLQEGDQLIMFTPIVHHDPEKYPNPMDYQWDRFLNANGKELPMRPFGGGPHYCPGRKFADNAAKAFVAHMVHNYDIEMEGEAEKAMGPRDGLGVLHSKAPVHITLRQRA